MFSPEISQALRRHAPNLSLTPCFSWVMHERMTIRTVSTVSTVCRKPLKRLESSWFPNTQLKQGVNEKQLFLLENV